MTTSFGGMMAQSYLVLLIQLIPLIRLIQNLGNGVRVLRQSSEELFPLVGHDV